LSKARFRTWLRMPGVATHTLDANIGILRQDRFGAAVGGSVVDDHHGGGRRVKGLDGFEQRRQPFGAVVVHHRERDVRRSERPACSDGRFAAAGVRILKVRHVEGGPENRGILPATANRNNMLADVAYRMGLRLTGELNEAVPDTIPQGCRKQGCFRQSVQGCIHSGPGGWCPALLHAMRSSCPAPSTCVTAEPARSFLFLPIRP
jgi:hypothetical protein